MFSSIHHIIEAHHHQDEECSASEKGEFHLHGWEFENCDLCDLQVNPNYLTAKTPIFQFVDISVKPYYFISNEALVTQQFFSFSNRGPPTA